MILTGMTTLKEAREKGKLDDFIKEHEADHDGDENAVKAAIKSMARRSKPVRKTSSRAGRGG